MHLNRTIKLTKPIRQDIANNVQKAWIREHPRPEIGLSPSGKQLQALTDWKEGKERMKLQTFSILETFTSVNQLQDLWPEVMPFVSRGLIDPSKHTCLPKAA